MNGVYLLLLAIQLLGNALFSSAFQNVYISSTRESQPQDLQREELRLCGKVDGDDTADIQPGSPTSKDPSLGVKAAWYSTEIFGDIASALSGGKSSLSNPSALDKSQPLDRAVALSYLKEDYGNDYFVTGCLSMDLYEDDCEFADPFVSFRGLDRFKKNLDNLGSFMQDVDIDIYDWKETEDAILTKWRFRCVLGLPWQPILACKGGTDHYFSSSSGRIERHVENWEIEPVDALKQLIKPNPKFRKK
mmetsp:Transcript_16134/g.21339  ORF Transcript_16134/g.21339 Transcript_16134/m.21339 type:complete len:247 (-) Transcript_16134:274-1014(-)|eukprot:CAMPEP_0117765642 /NCGR_PEP_ID=MMETSP0947-20121206/20271_1 /TAXON_ID=44440 /ORGANISM="Chattonella subsalsa, Strain CCMP2191" /LENGTH=246 /DNA_ID=CAMNT_0005588411 /DNA_START=77 /DNA_END=817 /DNA_ORIENTATION=+